MNIQPSPMTREHSQMVTEALVDQQKLIHQLSTKHGMSQFFNETRIQIDDKNRDPKTLEGQLARLYQDPISLQREEEFLYYYGPEGGPFSSSIARIIASDKPLMPEHYIIGRVSYLHEILNTHARNMAYYLPRSKRHEAIFTLSQVIEDFVYHLQLRRIDREKGKAEA